MIHIGHVRSLPGADPVFLNGGGGGQTRDQA